MPSGPGNDLQQHHNLIQDSQESCAIAKMTARCALCYSRAYSTVPP